MSTITNTARFRTRSFSIHALTFSLALIATLLPACADAPPDAPPPPEAAAGSHRAASGEANAPIPSIHLAPAFPKLSFKRPIFLTHAGDGSNRLFVVEQRGRILMFENRENVETTETFLDLRAKVRTNNNEEGLLSLAFHPKFKENGEFFVYYSVSDPKRNRISRFHVLKENPNVADPDSEQIILEVEQPYGNHNGSTLLFGPDGYLYASFGDGGAGGDPHANGQNLGTLLATIIRIDVDHQEEGRNYAIPKDNPFVDRAATQPRDGNPRPRPEIWAYGLRNVWRMSFDQETGNLWAGDVGQNAWEEIDLIVKGGNYGWSRREGTHPFTMGGQKGAEQAPADPFIEPVIDYSHRDGISVTGGYVYRGQRNKRLQGVYLYGDYGTRTIWGLRYEDGRVAAHRKLVSGAEGAVVASFGEDADHELFICAFDRYDGQNGKLLRIVEN